MTQLSKLKSYVIHKIKIVCNIVLKKDPEIIMFLYIKHAPFLQSTPLPPKKKNKKAQKQASCWKLKQILLLIDWIHREQNNEQFWLPSYGYFVMFYVERVFFAFQKTKYILHSRVNCMQDNMVCGFVFH